MKFEALETPDERSRLETEYLLASPANALRLAESLAESSASGGTIQVLVEE